MMSEVKQKKKKLANSKMHNLSYVKLMFFLVGKQVKQRDSQENQRRGHIRSELEPICCKRD